jgi:hypothetical protein
MVLGILKPAGPVRQLRLMKMKLCLHRDSFSRL